MSYFWVVDYAQSKDGSLRPVVIGGRSFTTELLAQRYMDDANLSGRAEIFELPTSNTSRATQAIKAKLVKRYKSLDKGITRAKHETPGYKSVVKSSEPSPREILRKRLKGISLRRRVSKKRGRDDEPEDMQRVKAVIR